MTGERRMHCGNYMPHDPHHFRPRPGKPRWLCDGTPLRPVDKL